MLKTDSTEVMAFDNTMLKAFQSCPRYFYWRHMRDLTTPTKSIPLEFGIAIHAGLDKFYSSAIESGGKGDVVKACETFLDRFKHCEGDDKRNLDNGVRILTNYAKEHPVEEEPWTPVEAEAYFEIVLADRIHYFGRVDLIIYWTGYGHIVVDHKTASWISDNYLKAHHVDRQFSGYDISAREHYEKVYGVMVNVLEVPKTLTRAPKVARELTSRTAVDRAIWVVETLDIIEQIQHCMKKNVWPMHAPFYCTAWNRMCEYFPLCSSHQHPEKVTITDDQYIVDPWHPYPELADE